MYFYLKCIESYNYIIYIFTLLFDNVYNYYNLISYLEVEVQNKKSIKNLHPKIENNLSNVCEYE